MPLPFLSLVYMLNYPIAMSVASDIRAMLGATELLGLIENMTSLMICAISPCWASIAILALVRCQRRVWW